MARFNHLPNMMLSIYNLLRINNKDRSTVTEEEVSSKSQDRKMADRGGWETEPFRDNTSGRILHFHCTQNFYLLTD